MRDPNMLSTLPEIAIFDTFIKERGKMLKDGMPINAKWMKQLRKWQQIMHEALFEKRDIVLVEKADKELSRLVADGANNFQNWQEILQVSERRTGMALRADEAQTRKQEALTESQGVQMFGLFLDCVRTVAMGVLAHHGIDPRKRTLIAKAIQEESGARFEEQYLTDEQPVRRGRQSHGKDLVAARATGEDW